MKPSLGSRLFVDAMALVGCLTCIDLLQFQSTDPLRFLYYLALGMSAAALQFRLAGVREAMPIYFLFTMPGLVDLSRSEFVVVAFCSACIQALWRSKPTRSQVLFEMTVSAVGAGLAHGAYQLPVWGYLDANVSFLPRFVTAAVIFGGCHTLAVTSRQSLLSGTSLREEWWDGYRWSLAYYTASALLTALLVVLSRSFGWRISWIFLPAVYLICYAYRLYVERLDSERKHAEETAALHLRTIEALALAIDANDHAAHDHLRRVQTYALEVGRDLGLSKDELEALRAAALLHDIGKLAVPEHIISKPGKLAPEEFEKMKVHPIVGAEILETARFPYPVVPIVRSHHEKWDGTGYPDGLHAEQIPIGARILAAVDCLDAMASDRNYRRALPLDEAMQVVISESGKSYDPAVVEVLNRRYKELDKLVRRDTGQSQETTASNDKKRSSRVAPCAIQDEVLSPAEPPDFLDSILAARQEATNLFELSQELGKSLSLCETLSVLAGRLKSMVPYDSIAVYIGRDGKLIPEYVGGDEFRQLSSLEIPIGAGISGWVASKKKPVLNGNPADEVGFCQDPARFSAMQSALSVPLTGIGDVIGVMTLFRRQPNAFTSDHLRILLTLVSKVALSIENALRFQQAESSATQDYLTGLPNARSLFLHLDSELSRAKRNKETMALLVCDMDGFKQVNDRFGHVQGNKVLQLVAARLRETCREYDYVARMGGDEFVVALSGVDQQTASAKANQMDALVRAGGVETFGEEIISLSVGIAFFPADAMNAEGLVAEADRRMYINKQARKKAAADLDMVPVQLALLAAEPAQS
jgi:diguanylate cyclase (GGDEF)-like protein/putative nucleotidyltransferase with HDIG domain